MKLPRLALIAFLLSACVFLHAQTEFLRIVATSDVHGNYLHYDYLKGREGNGGLSRIAAFVREQRRTYSASRIILLDGGDILQGRPDAYYYNFVDTESEHLCASALNFIGYDAGVPGNHDIETGHDVYDRWTLACHHPVVCANVIDRRYGTPYWQPYTIINRGGIRIAVIGLLTPTVPKWLPEQLWSGLYFDDMLATAQRCVAEIQEKNLADAIVGVFHSGAGRADDTGKNIENASLQVAANVAGFNLIISGHDHRAAVYHVKNPTGDDVLVLNPGAGGSNVAVADIIFKRKRGSWLVEQVSGELAEVSQWPADEAFNSHFHTQHEALRTFADKPLAYLDTLISSRDAFFGPSAFVDLIHRLQLSLTDADISFAAPLSFDVTLQKDTLRVRHLFQLYRYENRLYTLRLTGREIRNYLEKSYDGWVRTMQSPSDTMLRFQPHPATFAEGWQRLATPSYNFDSAAGLCYSVDLRASLGTRLHIDSLSNGRTFSDDSTYTVAVNSYRANGGGDLLTDGAGIPKDKLPGRICKTTQRDVRYYLLQMFEQQGNIRIFHPTPEQNWCFVPQTWAEQARKRETSLLFGQ